MTSWSLNVSSVIYVMIDLSQRLVNLLWPNHQLLVNQSRLDKPPLMTHSCIPAGAKFIMTSSNGKIFHVTGPLCEEFTGHRWIPRTKGQWCGALMFPLICTWIYVSANNHEAGDLRHHRAHYDITVMCRQERDFQLTFDPWIQLIQLDGSRIKILANMTAVNLCIYPTKVTWGQWAILFQ